MEGIGNQSQMVGENGVGTALNQMMRGWLDFGQL